MSSLSSVNISTLNPLGSPRSSTTRRDKKSKTCQKVAAFATKNSLSLKNTNLKESFEEKISRKICNGTEHPNWLIPITDQLMIKEGYSYRNQLPLNFFKKIFPDLSIKASINYVKGNTNHTDLTKEDVQKYYGYGSNAEITEKRLNQLNAYQDGCVEKFYRESLRKTP